MFIEKISSDVRTYPYHISDVHRLVVWRCVKEKTNAEQQLHHCEFDRLGSIRLANGFSVQILDIRPVTFP